MRILVYHGVVKKLDNFDRFFQKHILIGDFKKQVSIVRKRYQVLALKEFCDKWQDRKLRDNEALIFFDDCYRNAIDGLEILERLKMPAIFSVSSDLVAKGFFWGDDIEKVVINTKKKIIKFNKFVFDVSSEIKRFKAVLRLKNYFRNISTNSIEKELENLIVVCGVNPREICSGKFDIISWDDLRKIKSSVFFDIAHHGHLHYPLSRFPNKEKITKDIKTNVEILKEKLRIKPLVFVYPFGKKDDYNDTAKKILRNQGFKFAFSMESRPINYKDPFDIPRIILQ